MDVAGPEGQQDVAGLEQRAQRVGRVGHRRSDAHGAVAQAVSKNPNAIGYVGLSYLNDDLKGLTVNGEKASIDNPTAYPISRVLYMFTKGWPTGTTLQFINFVMHPQKGQKIVAEADFIPLY